jgi:hypothetical protein
VPAEDLDETRVADGRWQQIQPGAVRKDVEEAADAVRSRRITT